MLYIFLPAIILLGLATTYQDYLFGKIRNKYIITALVYAFIVNGIIILYHFSGETLNTSYYVLYVSNFIFAVLIGFSFWLFGFWTAGDGKLFIAYAALIPLTTYNYGYIEYIPSVVILINAFLPAFVYFIISAIRKTSYKEKLDAISNVLNMRKVTGSLSTVFVLYWLVKLFFGYFHINNNFFLTIFTVMVANYLIEMILPLNVRDSFLLIAIVRIIIDPSIYSLSFLTRICTLFSLWFIFRIFFIELSKKAFVKEIAINKLKRGMVLADIVYYDRISYKKKPPDKGSLKDQENLLFESLPRGLTKDDIVKLKGLDKDKRLRFDSLRVKETIAFAPFLFIGVMITILANGSFFGLKDLLDTTLALKTFPVIYTFILLGIIYFVYAGFNHIRTFFKNISKVTWLCVLIIVVLVLVLRFFIIPHTHYVYHDEYEHITIAKSILETGMPVRCLLHSSETCLKFDIPSWPSGIHFLYALVMRIFGLSDTIVFNLVSLLSTISVFIFFLLSYTIFKDQKTALWSMLFATLCPVYLIFGGSAALSPGSLLFILLFLLFWFMYQKGKELTFLIISFLSLAYAVNARPENSVLLLVPILSLILDKTKINKQAFKWIGVASICVCILIMPALHHIMIGLHNEDPGWSDSIEKHTIHLEENIIPNLLFFFNPLYSLTLVSILSCLFIYSSFDKHKKTILFFITFFFMFFLIYSSYHIGHLPGLGDSVRYSHVLFIPLILFGSQYAGWFLDKRRRYHVYAAALLLILVANAFYSVTYLSGISENLRQEYNLIKEGGNVLDKNCTIYAMQPASTMSTINYPSSHIDFFEKRSGCSYIFKDFWWYAEKNKDTREEIGSNNTLEPIFSRNISGYLIGFFSVG